MSVETKRAPSGRPKRQPVGLRNRLSVEGKEPGYVYRWVNDEPGRITLFENAGYEFVEADKVILGNRRLGQPAQEGEKASAHVGGGQKAYVMRIKEEYYNEDQEAKLQQVRETQEAMKHKSKSEIGAYGSIEIGSKTSK